MAVAKKKTVAKKPVAKKPVAKKVETKVEETNPTEAEKEREEKERIEREERERKAKEQEEKERIEREEKERVEREEAKLKSPITVEDSYEMKTTEKEKNKDTWEIKDRQYYLLSNEGAIIRMIRSKGIYYFDEEAGYERELKLTSNQKTPFVDEFKGPARLEHIVFRDGVLNVPKNKQILQKLLSLYHPQKGLVYEEVNNEAEAVDELSAIEVELEAMNTASQMDIDLAEAIVRTDVGSAVSKMTSKEIKRDLMLLARKNPALFLELANDENISIRNLGIKAVEMGIIKLSGDQRTFLWGSNSRKLITVPFDENPYSALAAYFKTDDGFDVYQQVAKMIN